MSYSIDKLRLQLGFILPILATKVVTRDHVAYALH